MDRNVGFMFSYLHNYAECLNFATVKRKKTMKRTILLLLALSSFLLSNAQIHNMMNNVRTITVKMSLSDAKTGEAVSYAAVWLTEKGDTVIKSYGISDDAGHVVIDGVRQGKYDVHVEMMGYESFVKTCDIKVQEFENERNLGRVQLVQSNNYLEAVTVSATATPVKMKTDTIEYNANAFHVSESAKLGELLKKMPGIKVAKDGSVKVNGEKIDKITMDGKTLFIKDPAMAVKNLPANMVDRVQVIDRAKDHAQFTGIGTKDDQEKILDLQLKEEYKQGWFGNAKVSGGASLLPSDELEYKGQGQILYNTNGMLSHYTPEDQLILLATGLNAPEPGGMEEDNMDFQMEGMDNDLLVGRQGLTTSAQTGLNYNTTRLFNLESSASVNYNYNHKTVNEKSARTSFLSNAPSLQTDGQFHGVGNTHGTSMSMELKNTDKAKYLFAFRPYLNFGWQNAKSDNTSRTVTNGVENNNSNSTASTDSKNVSLFSELELGVRDLGKERRSITLTNEFMYDVQDGNSMERSKTSYGGVIDLRDLDYDNAMLNIMPELELSYVEPLGKDWALQLRTSGSYSTSKTDKRATDLNDASRNDYYSSYSKNEDYNLRQRMLLQYKNDQASLLFGLQMNEQQNITTTRHLGLDSEVGRGDWIYNWAPFVDYNHKSDNFTARIHYTGRSTTPSGSRIVPTLNLSNPVQIGIGNIYLRPQFSHDLFLTLRKSNPDNFSFYEIFMDGGLRRNQIVSASWFDASGVRYSIPVNSKDLGVNASVYVSYSKPFGKEDNFTLTLDADANLDLGVGYQAKGTLAAIDKDHFSYSGLMKWLWNDGTDELFYSGKSGFAASRTRTVSMSLFPTLMYRQDWLSITAMGFAMNSRSHYSIDDSNDMNTWDFGTDFEFLATTGNEWEFNSDISYMWHRGYSEGYGTPELLWNAGVSKALGNFTLSLKVSDILNQQKSLHRTATADYVEDVYRSVMGRYFLVGVTFNFGKMNASHGEQVERAMWEMQW